VLPVDSMVVYPLDFDLRNIEKAASALSRGFFIFVGLPGKELRDNVMAFFNLTRTSRNQQKI
jgi:hypothetical protein